MKVNFKKISWRSFAEAIAVLSVVITLIFVIYELRLIRTVAYVEGIGVARELAANTSQMITENSDIWYRGCIGEELNDAERTIFYRIAFSVYLRFNYQWARTQNDLGDPYQLERIPTVLALNMYYFPGFDKAIRERLGLGTSMTPDMILQEVFGPRGDNFTIAILQKFDLINSIKPELSADAVICGT